MFLFWKYGQRTEAEGQSTGRKEHANMWTAWKCVFLDLQAVPFLSRDREQFPIYFVTGQSAAVLPGGSASGVGWGCRGESTGSSSPCPAEAAYSGDTSTRHLGQAGGREIHISVLKQHKTSICMYFIALIELCVYMLVGYCCCAITKIPVNSSGNTVHPQSFLQSRLTHREWSMAYLTGGVTVIWAWRNENSSCLVHCWYQKLLRNTDGSRKFPRVSLTDPGAACPAGRPPFRTSPTLTFCLWRNRASLLWQASNSCCEQILPRRHRCGF